MGGVVLMEGTRQRRGEHMRDKSRTREPQSTEGGTNERPNQEIGKGTTGFPHTWGVHSACRF